MQLFSLVKVQFPDYFGFRHFSIKSIFKIIPYALLDVFMYMIIKNLAQSYAAVGMSYLIISIVFALISLFTLYMSFAKGDIYNNQEYEILITMPIKRRTIILSKFLQIYFNNLFLTIFVMIPCLFAYASFETISVLFVIRYFLVVLFIPVLPTIVSIFISSIITLIASFFRHFDRVKSILVTLLGLLLLVACFAFLQVSSTSDVIDIEASISSSFKFINPLYNYFIDFLLNGSIKSALMYFGLSSILVVLGVYIFGFSYTKVVSRVSNVENIGKRAKINFKEHSLTTALLKKDVKLMINDPVDLLFPYMFSLALVVLAIAIKFVDVSSWGFDIISILPIVFILLILLSNTSSVSMSLEGGNVATLKALPIKNSTTFIIKMLPNMVINMFLGIVSLIGFSITLGVDINTFITCLISIIVASIFTSIWGLLINLLFVNKRADVSVGYSPASIISMISLLLIGIAILYIGMNYIVLINILLAIIIILISIYLTKSGNKLLAKFIN